MISLAGYQINNEIHKSNRTIVFRGTRLSDNCPVVIKYLSKEYPTSKELSDFTYEYKIMNKLSGEGIIKPYDIVKYGNSLAIIMEDIGGESIADAMKSTKLSITEKMLLSIQMTDSLLQVHKQNIIHKDVNPSNFIWNRKTNQVKIIDFGISTELASEDFQYTNTMNPDGTLEYMSPEQTGRINKPVDYRTDFYSLGITLYELFSGKLPFAGEDESEMVYYHIAKTPAPLYLVSPEIPKCLSDIVMKLISKSAEERYQSASGIKKDLEHCYQSLKSGTEISNFVPGKDDIIERFESPYKLFGREEEIEILVKKFEDASKGNCELVLVGGYPGIGKSSLINEIRKPITFRKGRFIYGKCEQRKCNTPYYGLRQAFQELVRQLLTEPQSSLDTWKQRLMDALGENGQLITDIIPDLEQIIGLQPHATELNPVESQNRIQMVFLEFIKVFAQKEHPLIIFLDDLQWCDAATINLIYYIFSMDTLQYALFVCAYRDNELQAGYRISQLFEKLRELNSCTELFLKPLDFTAVNDLVSETLHSPPDATKPLTELIIKKTNGNPFFTIKMLKSLYLQKAFTFIPEKGQWSFDLEKVRNAEISDNLIDLIIKGLESLSERTVNTLKLAACIGNQFDFRTLLLVKNDPESLLNKDLWTAINKEIIIPLDNNYRLIGSLSAEMYKDVPIRFSFTHERVRQAVYSLITDNDRAKMHLSIGYIYLKLFQKEKRTDLLYDLVNHLNIGRELIQNIKELIELSDLNIMAGSKAKKSTAFAAAENYFAIAQSLLSDELWAKTPRKYFKLLIDRANVALLSGNLTLSENLCIRLLDKAQSNIDKASISIIRVQIFEYQGKHKEAIDEVRRSLRLFDIHLPDNDQEIVQKIHKGIFKLKSYLKRITIDGLKNLPEMKDPEKIIIMQMVFQMVPAAYQSNPQLFVLISLMMFELTCEYGVSPLSCKCFTDCAIILGSLGEYETGYKLAEAAFSLLNRLKAEAFRASVCYGFTFTSYTRAHYSESLNYYDMAYHKGLETGDIHHASFALADKLLLLLYTGKNLNECMQETEDAVTYLNKINISLPQLLAQMIHYMIRKFQSVHDKKEEKNFLRKDEEIITTLKSTNNLGFLCRFYILNAYMNIIFGKMDDAEKWNNMAQEVIRSTGLVQDYSVPDHYMFQGLILCNKMVRLI